MNWKPIKPASWGTQAKYSEISETSLVRVWNNLYYWVKGYYGDYERYSHHHGRALRRCVWNRLRCNPKGKGNKAWKRAKKLMNDPWTYCPFETARSILSERL